MKTGRQVKEAVKVVAASFETKIVKVSAPQTGLKCSFEEWCAMIQAYQFEDRSFETGSAIKFHFESGDSITFNF